MKESFTDEGRFSVSDGGSATGSSSDTAAGSQLLILYRFIRIMFQILVRISLVGVDSNRVVEEMIHEIDCENGTCGVFHDMNGDVVRNVNDMRKNQQRKNQQRKLIRQGKHESLA